MSFVYPTSPDDPVRDRNIFLRPLGAWRVLRLSPGLRPGATLSRRRGLVRADFNLKW